jgi:hypothetical protein
MLVAAQAVADKDQDSHKVEPVVPAVADQVVQILVSGKAAMDRLIGEVAAEVLVDPVVQAPDFQVLADQVL